MAIRHRVVPLVYPSMIQVTVLLLALLLGMVPGVVRAGIGAHLGPEGLEPVMVDRRVGPYLVTLSANPQRQASQFEVEVTLDGDPLSATSRVWLQALPVGERDEPLRGTTTRLDEHFFTVMPLGRAGRWQINVVIEGDAGAAATSVEVRIPGRTPPAVRWLFGLLLFGLLLGATAHLWRSRQPGTPDALPVARVRDETG